MKSNPAGPGGSLTSKPAWSNASGYSSTSFFLLEAYCSAFAEKRRFCGLAG